MMHSDIGLPSWERSCATKMGSGSALGIKRSIRQWTMKRKERFERHTHLDVVALVVVAALAEQTMLDDSVDIELVEDGVGVLGERGGEDDDLVDLAHGLQEGCSGVSSASVPLEAKLNSERLTIDSRSLDDIDIVVLILNLDGYHVICLVYHLCEREKISRELNR